MLKRPILASLFLAFNACAASSAHAATFVVTRGDDPLPGGCLAGDCSLREAIGATAVTPAADTIMLGAGLYNITRGELNVGGDVSI